jgi:hypothetical protein
MTVHTVRAGARSLSDAAPATARARAQLAAFAVVAAIAVFHVATVREGHAWGDDFSLYILHARNIAGGVPYAQTGYIFNERMSLIGPETYPPVFPVLLAPVYLAFGLNLFALKLVGIAFFAAALVLVLRMFADQVEPVEAVVLVAAVGLNPLFWSFKDNVVSDLPFLAFVWAGLYLCRSAHRSDGSVDDRAGIVLLTSLSFYLAYGTRSVGLILLPCLWAYTALAFRRPTAFAVKVSALTLLAVIAQGALLHSDRGYLSVFGFGPGGEGEGWRFILRTPFENPPLLLSSFSELWENGYSGRGRQAVTLLGLAAAGVGFIGRVRRALTPYEVFVVLYTTAIVLLPMEMDPRFMFPVLPFFFRYVLVGVRSLFGGPAASRGLVAVCVLIAAVYGSRYTTLAFGPIDDGITSAPVRQFVEYIRSHTGDRDVVVFRRPRALALLAERRSAAAHVAADDNELSRYLRSIGATYLVIGPEHVDPAYHAYLTGVVRRQADRFEQVFANAEFTVYRIA